MPNRRSLSLTFLAALLAVAIGIVLSYAIHWFPVEASTQAHNTDTLEHDRDTYVVNRDVVKHPEVQARLALSA